MTRQKKVNFDNHNGNHNSFVLVFDNLNNVYKCLYTMNFERPKLVNEYLLYSFRQKKLIS